MSTHSTLISKTDPDLEQASRFLKAFTGGEPVTFQTADDSEKKRPQLARILHGTLDQHVKELTGLNKQGAGIFMMINEGDLVGRTAKSVVSVRAVFVDLDGAPLEPVRDDAPVKPHIIVESSPGRYHAYWKVSDCPLEQFKLIQKSLAAKFWGDPSVCDLSRVMRLPGFFHRKAEPFMTICVVELMDPYRASQVINGLGLLMKPVARVFSEPQKPDGQKVGKPLRHEHLRRRVLPRLRSAGLRGEALFSAAWDIVKNTFDLIPDFGVGEVRKLCEWFDEQESSETSPNQTDMGNTQRLATRFGERVRHCKALGWFVYDGKRWAPDSTAQIQAFAKETVREMYLTAAQEADEERRKALISFSLKCEAANRIGAMIQLLPSEPCISVLHEVFDRDKMLFNVLNGTIDLRSGCIRPHSPNDLITKLAPVEYDPDAKCERWEQFILEIMDEDAELGSFLQRLLGYSLSGETREQIWSFLWGKGDNGKGVLLATLAHVLGDYARTTPPETFMEVTDKERLHELARLRGARLVTVSELPIDKKFNPRILKAFTGEDIVTARAMYKDGFEYLPEAKLFFSANHRPAVGDTSHGFWRRPILIPFTRVFEPYEKDDTLRERFRAESPGILNWLIRGCLDWQAMGLNTPQTVLSAVDEYRSETDVLADFLESHCDVGPGQTVAVKMLYESYQAYCEDKNIHRALGKQRFNEDLLGRPGVAKRRVETSEGRPWKWLGIGLKAQDQAQTRRSCKTCNLEGEPCPKVGSKEDTATCEDYEIYH